MSFFEFHIKNRLLVIYFVKYNNSKNIEKKEPHFFDPLHIPENTALLVLIHHEYFLKYIEVNLWHHWLELLGIKDLFH